MPQKRRGRRGLEVVTRPGRPGLYIRGTVAGRNIFESAGTDNAALAEEKRAARETELYRSAIYGEKSATTFTVAAHSYLTTEARSKATKILIGRLNDHFGPKITCDAITQSEIDKACTKLCRPDAQPSTKLRSVVAPVRAILAHAARRGWCPPPMFETMRGARKRTDWFTPADAEALIRCAYEGVKPLLTFLFCEGVRANEAFGLDWADVDLRNRRATIRGQKDADGLRGTKSGLDRILELTPRSVATLANLPHRTGRVFLSRYGQPYRDSNDTTALPYGGQIKNVWATAMRRAGINRRMTPHHARHTWATWHYVVHKDPMKLRDDGGWSEINMVERYAKLAPNGIRDDVLAFWCLPAKSANIVPTQSQDRASA
jgi:integrase